MNTLTELQKRVNSIANDINEGLEQAFCPDCHQFHDISAQFCPSCGEPTDTASMSGFMYLNDVLDIQYTVSSDLKTMLGARLLVSYGGPNIWIDTMRGEVEGTSIFGGQQPLFVTATAKFYEDPMGVEMARLASDLYWATR